MAPVASSAAKDKKDEVWTKLPLYLDETAKDTLMTYDIYEVLKLSSPPSAPLSKPNEHTAKMGASAEITAARDLLASDPYNMHSINELAYLYAKVALYEQCINILMRGWKRADEIKDPVVRFHFLMKLVEASHVRKQFRQAFAVLKDIQEPDDPNRKLSYLVLSCRVYANIGDLPGALKCFQRALEGQEFDLAIRIWALVLREFSLSGAAEAAKSTMEKLAGDDAMKVMKLQMLDGLKFEEKTISNLKRQEKMKKYVIIGAVVMFFLIVLYLLYLWEQSSLKALNMKPS